MKKILLPLMMVSATASAANSPQQYCHTDVILKNMLQNSMTSDGASLTITPQTGSNPTWDPNWSNTTLPPSQSTQSIMTYLNIQGNPPQFNSQFSVGDNQGGICTFSPWIIAGCNVVWNWNCTTDANFKPVFWHSKRNSWGVIDPSPWIINFQNK